MSKKAKAAKAKPKRKIKKGPAKKMTGSAAQRNKDDRTTPRELERQLNIGCIRYEIDDPRMAGHAMHRRVA